MIWFGCAVGLGDMKAVQYAFLIVYFRDFKVYLLYSEYTPTAQQLNLTVGMHVYTSLALSQIQLLVYDLSSSRTNS